MKITIAAMTVCALVAASSSPVCAGIMLGPFDFDPAGFGNTLVESDGGALSSANWLGIANVDPGNPGYLTGPNFDSGVANIGLAANNTIYTIGYDTPIPNALGADFGVVVARFSVDDISVAVSTDGMSFTSSLVYLAGTAVDTGVVKQYYSHASDDPGPYPASLHVHAIDLDDFGIAPGATIKAIRITDGGSTELDLIRVAAFSVIPEPGSVSLALLAAGSLLLFATGRRRRRLVGAH